MIYTPTIAATLYVLDVAMSAGSHIVAPNSFEDDVHATSPPVTGPYLTTRDDFKVAWDLKSNTFDAIIDALLPQVTDLIQSLSDRVFFESTVTEYPSVKGCPLSRLFLARPPVTSITSLHLSVSWPRVYDATTLLVDGTDFTFDDANGIIELASPRYLSGGSLLKAAKVVYIGGYSSIPGDVQRAAQEVLGVKLEKGKASAYHLTSEARLDGSIAGLRFDDMTPNALVVIEKYRVRTF